MKTPNKVTEKNVALLAGTDALDLYLKEISWNLRTMMGQFDVLETAVFELRKLQQRENTAIKQSVAHPNSAQGIVQASADRFGIELSQRK